MNLFAIAKIIFPYSFIGVIFMVLHTSLVSCRQQVNAYPASDADFTLIDSLIRHKDFFAARDLFQEKQSLLSEYQTLRAGAALDNAFNRLEASNEKIDALFSNHENMLSDSAKLFLLDLHQSNSVKLFQYQAAQAAIDSILKNFGHLLAEKELKGFENTRIIWAALAGKPRQEVHVMEDTRIQMSRDIAGLTNLPVSNGKDSLGFIFDTGANLSTVTAATAQRLDMDQIDIDFEVTSITGEKVPAKLAVSKDLYIRGIHLQHVVFIVFPDEPLFIPQFPYQINGIIGFPVIAALGEVHISKSDEFFVPVEPGTSDFQNLALDYLTPVIELDGEPYTFDTGADETMLYAPYYRKYREQIDGKYQLADLTFGGAGGSITQKGYYVPFERQLFDTTVRLDSLMLFEENIRSSVDDYYGNIGQDLIGKFDRMILNFNKMFIHFEK